MAAAHAVTPAKKPVPKPAPKTVNQTAYKMERFSRVEWRQTHLGSIEGLVFSRLSRGGVPGYVISYQVDGQILSTRAATKAFFEEKLAFAARLPALIAPEMITCRMPLITVKKEAAGRLEKKTACLDTLNPQLRNEFIVWREETRSYAEGRYLDFLTKVAKK